MAKVLIMTETIGGNGHFRAAQSLMRGMERVVPQVPVEIICGLPHFSKQLEKITRKVYLNTLHYAPGLWGAVYAKEEEFSHTFRDGVAKVLAKKLQPAVAREKPRVVVCTHAFCLGALGHIKEQGAPFRLGAAITDFDVNGFWVHPAVDFYLVAHPSVAEILVRRFHVPRKKVFCTGIPIDPAFAEERGEKEGIRIRQGWDPAPFTVLLMGGGVGIGPMEACIRQFRKELPEAQLVVVTGKNRLLYNRLAGFFADYPRIHLYGFVEEMADLMAASDLILSKPGGLTSSEALATGLPLVICQPIPGQEERNSRFLIREQVAVRQDQPRHVPAQIQSLTASARWVRMSERAFSLGRPRSALDAAQVVMHHWA